MLGFFICAGMIQAQFSNEVKDQFKKIMLAFPDGFTSIKGAQVTKYDENMFYSKQIITGAEHNVIIKNEVSGKLEFDATLLANDDDNFKVFETLFDKWKDNIDKLDFNGAKLIDYPSDKYGTKDSDMYAKGNAWRLDGGTIGLDPKYKDFTIRLELLDLDQGGFMVKLLVTGE